MKKYNNFRTTSRLAALGTAVVLMTTPIAANAEGLAELLSRNGVEAQEYVSTELDLNSWENGFISKTDDCAYKFYTKYCPALAEQAGASIAAMYMFSNFDSTPQDLIAEIAEKGYILPTNCVDLVWVNEEKTAAQPVDPDGFTNLNNATNCYNKINDMAEKHMREDFYKYREGKRGKLNPEDYPDPSVFIQDERQKGIVHQWFVDFVNGYDLNKGTYSNNEKLQSVYRAIAQSNGDRAEPSLNSLDPGVAFLVRATLANWYRVFTENYMHDNKLEELRKIRYYNIGEITGNNETFIKYDDAEFPIEKCVSELHELVNAREALYIITNYDLTDELMNKVLHQNVKSFEDYQEALKNNTK